MQFSNSANIRNCGQSRIMIIGALFLVSVILSSCCSTPKVEFKKDDLTPTDDIALWGWWKTPLVDAPLTEGSSYGLGDTLYSAVSGDMKARIRAIREVEWLLQDIKVGSYVNRSFGQRFYDHFPNQKVYIDTGNLVRFTLRKWGRAKLSS